MSAGPLNLGAAFSTCSRNVSSVVRRGVPLDGDAKVARQQPLKNRRRIGPRSGVSAIKNLDGRRREARRLREIEADLGGFAVNGTGVISQGQRYLVARLAIDILRLEMMDGRMAAGTITDTDAKV